MRRSSPGTGGPVLSPGSSGGASVNSLGRYGLVEGRQAGWKCLMARDPVSYPASAVVACPGLPAPAGPGHQVTSPFLRGRTRQEPGARANTGRRVLLLRGRTLTPA